MADAHPRTRSHLARTWTAVRRLVASRSAVVGPRLVAALARLARPGLRLALVPLLAVSLAAQVLSWEAGVALLAPTAVVVALLALVAAAAGRRPTVGIAAAAAFAVAAGLVAAAPSGRYTTTDGYQLGLVDGRIVGAVGDGPGAGVVRGPAVDDGRQHVVSLLWDGAVVPLAVDGDVADAVPYDGPVARSDTLVVGATTDDRYHLRGVVTDLHLDLAPDGAVRDGTTPTGTHTGLPDPHPRLPLSTVSNAEPSYRGV